MQYLKQCKESEFKGKLKWQGSEHVFKIADQKEKNSVESSGEI